MTQPARPCAVMVRRRTGTQGTFGTLTLPGLLLATGELPWHGNAYGLSCIPTGRYACEPRESENRGHHFQLTGVPQRQEILIHAGHWCGDEVQGLRSDVRGCILLGTGVGAIAGQDAMRHSRTALDRLLGAAPHGLDLIIHDQTAEGQAGEGWRP